MPYRLHQQPSGRGSVPAADGWARYNTEEIFREMVLAEIQIGRVSRAHHARMLGYAAQLGITKAAAANLISDCCTEAAASNNPRVRRHAERLASPHAGRTLRTCFIIAAIIAAQLALIFLL